MAARALWLLGLWSSISLGLQSELWINLWNESTRYDSSFPGWKENFNDSAVFYCRGSPEVYFGYWLRSDHETGEEERFCVLMDYVRKTGFGRFLFLYYGEKNLRVDVQIDVHRQELHSRTLVNREVYPRDGFRCVHGRSNVSFTVAEASVRPLPGLEDGYEITCPATNLSPTGPVTTQWLIGSLPHPDERPIVLQDPDFFTVRWEAGGDLWEDREHQAGNLSRILSFNETQLAFVRRPPFCVDCYHQSGDRVAAVRECVDRPGPPGIHGRVHRPANRIRDPVAELSSVPPTNPETNPDPELGVRIDLIFLVLWFPFLIVMSAFIMVIRCLTEEAQHLKRVIRRVRDRFRAYLLKLVHIGRKLAFRPVPWNRGEERTPLLETQVEI